MSAIALIAFPLFLSASASDREVLSHSPGAAPQVSLVRRLRRSGRDLSALSVLLLNFEAAGKPVPDRLRLMLNEAQEAFFRGEGGEFSTYVLRRGDVLGKVGRKYGITPEFLKRVNAVRNERSLPAGRALKVVEGPFRAEVSLARKRLRVFLDHALVREFRVAVGAPESPTPTGDFKVVQKVKNPRYDNDGEHYPPGDPRNPAGTRWLRLKGPIGIHGTNEPDSIGKAVSDGCIRLKNRDVEELFDLLVIGSPVSIRP